MRRRNTEMKLRVVESLLLVFVITVLGNSSARVIQGQEENKNKLEMTEIKATFSQKEPSERSGAVHMRKLGFGGKKLSPHDHEESSVDSKNEKGEDGGKNTKISGEDKDALRKSFGCLRDEHNNNDQHMQKKHMTTTMGPNASKFTNFVTPRTTSSPSNANSKCSQDSEEEPQGTTIQKDDETQSLNVEAANEIVNLIHRDYRATPRHKPPINNHVPRN